MEVNHIMVEQSSTTVMQIPQRVFDILHQKLEVVWKFSRNKGMIGKSISREVNLLILKPKFLVPQLKSRR
jgi:hypothetical protein